MADTPKTPTPPDPTAAVIPTYLLDRLIAAGKGNVTLSTLRQQQLDALPNDCPNCDNFSGLITIPATDTTPAVTVPDPLCGGMGKTLAAYTKTCTGYEYTEAQPSQG